jgi:hypothetical protein
VLDHREAERYRIVESLLQAEGLELSHPCISCAWATRQGIVQQEGLDRLAGAARDELKGSHRGPGLPSLDEEDGLPGQVRSGHLRHAEACFKPSLPDHGSVDVDAEKAPAWLGLAVAYAAVISRQAIGGYE